MEHPWRILAWRAKNPQRESYVRIPKRILKRIHRENPEKNPRKESYERIPGKNP